MVYRIEVSANNRAGCKNTECKKAGVKIAKGQMRFGSWVEGPDFQSWAWKHWGCVTPKQILNLKTTLDDDATELDGYEDLPEDFQEKIRNALHEGHVADEDWGGDVEMNRAGKNGYRTPASKKAKKEALDEAQSPSPSKSSSKKRSHVKDDPDEQGAELDDSEPKKKKKKASVKKEAKTKKEETNGGSTSETQPAKKGQKRSAKVKAEAGDEDAMLGIPVKKARAPRKAATGKKVKDEDTDSEAVSDLPEADSSPPAKKARAPRKSAATNRFKQENDDVDTLGDAADQTSVPPAKKLKASRKATAKKIKDEAADEPAASDTLEATVPAPARVKKGTAPRKASAAKGIKSEGFEGAPDNILSASGAHDATDKPKIEENIETEDGTGGGDEVIKEALSARGGDNEPFEKTANAAEASVTKKAKRISHQTKASDNAEKPKRANGRVTRSHGD